MIRGPYWTGAVTPSGACAFVSQPQPHFTVSIWCSVVTAFTGGMSMTCLRSTAVTGAFLRDFPQQPHLAGRCFTVLSGWSVSCIVAPGWPFGRPGLRPDFPRSDFGAGFAGPSDDGGFEEFREFDFTWAARSATCDCSPASLAQHRVLGGLLRDPRVPLGQQLPQPRVRSAKPAITAVGNAGHLGHGRTLPRLRPARK